MSGSRMLYAMSPMSAYTGSTMRSRAARPDSSNRERSSPRRRLTAMAAPEPMASAASMKKLCAIWARLKPVTSVGPAFLSTER